MHSMNNNQLYTAAATADTLTIELVDLTCAVMRALGVTRVHEILDALESVKLAAVDFEERLGGAGMELLVQDDEIARLKAQIATFEAKGLEITSKALEMVENSGILLETTSNTPEMREIGHISPELEDITVELTPIVDVWETRLTFVKGAAQRITERQHSADTELLKKTADVAERMTSELAKWALEPDAPVWVGSTRRWAQAAVVTLTGKLQTTPAPAPVRNTSSLCTCPKCQGTGTHSPTLNRPELGGKCSLCAVKGHDPRRVPVKLADAWLASQYGVRRYGKVTTVAALRAEQILV